MGTIQNGRRFSSEFAKATEVNEQTRVLIQTTDNPVQYGELSQFKEVINNGMASKVELNQATEEINNNLEENYARTTDRYPKLTAGFAQDIVGDDSATPEEFSFRPTAGEDRNVANTTYYEGERNGVARMKNIKGNSVVLNQLVNTLFSPSTTSDTFTSNGITFTKLTNTLYRVSGSNATTSSSLSNNTKSNIALSAGHHYLFLIQGCNKSRINCYAPNSGAGFDGNESIIVSPSIDVNAFVRIAVGAGVTDVNEDILCCAIDLTRMFQAGNEPTTIEEFWQRLPEGVDLNAYNVGEIADGHYEAVKTTGFNQFNGTYAKVCAGCPYYLGGNYTSLGFTTEEGGTTEAITLPTSTESVGTTPSDRLYTPSQNGYIYAEGENININLSWDTEYGYLNGTYQPYKPFTRDLSWANKYFPATINGETQYGMRSAGSVRDEIRFNHTTQKWEAVQNVGVRAYAEGDAEDTSVTTDGTNTNYALATPIVTEIIEDVNLDFDVSDYGTEELIVAEGAQSAPLVADITYAPNALSTIKQVPDILQRLKALESAVAQQTTNVEPSNIEE